MKYFLLNLKQQLLNHPDLAGFFALISSILSFLIKTWKFDIFLVFGMFLMVFLDTVTGIRNARRKGTFDYRVLKEKTFSKVFGYILFILALSILTVALFILNNYDGTPFINDYLINIPLMTAIMFFIGIEFLSTNDNLKSGYGIKTPSSVTDKVSKFVDNQDIKDILKNDN